MSTRNDGRETTILETGSILIKNQKYHVVLTERRIVFTGDSANHHRSIPVPAIRQVELDTDDDGNPVLKVSAPSVHGEIKKVVLCFSKRDFPNAHELRYLWYSEIRKRILQPVTVSPSTIPENVSTETLFCMHCGNRLVYGSIFCDRCGAKIPYPLPSFSPEQEGGSVTGRPVKPAHPPAKDDLPRKERSVSRPGDTGINKEDRAIEAPGREPWKKKSFFTGSRIRKSSLIIGICMAAGILIMAVIFMAVPSGSPGFNLTSTGLNVSLPDLNAVASPVSPVVITATDAEPPAPPANPEELTIPEDTAVQPALTAAPGDPGAVLATYQSLFNNGDGTGLHALLSENIKSQYPVEELNDELSVARSDGYSIEKIQVTDQIVEGDSAILVLDISWMVAGSPIASTPNIPVVYENNQWKLHTLILHP